MSDDLNAIRERAEAATEGPWWYDEDDQCWRLHGVAGRIPPQMDGAIPEQIVNEQILKAPKTGTPYAEYWPKPADAELIVHAWRDIRALLAEVARLRESVDRHRHFATAAANAANEMRVQRDDARGIAVALEQQVAEIEKYAYMRHSDEWVRRRILSVFERAKREATS